MKRKITQDIENNGFAIIKSLLTKKEIKFLLKKINLLHSKKITKFKGTPNRDKNDKIIYNLQNKDYRFIKILSKKNIIKIAKYFLNDEYYSYLPKNVPNYNILYYNARSSGDKLDLHIDSHIPFKGFDFSRNFSLNPMTIPGSDNEKAIFTSGKS